MQSYQMSMQIQAALERVLADAKLCGADKVVCAGDVVWYGPDPAGAWLAI